MLGLEVHVMLKRNLDILFLGTPWYYQFGDYVDRIRKLEIKQGNCCQNDPTHLRNNFGYYHISSQKESHR